MEEIKDKKKKCRATGIACFPLGALFAAFAVVCLVWAIIVIAAPDDTEYGEYFIVALFTYFFRRWVITALLGGTLICGAVAFVEIYFGIGLIRNAGNESKERLLRRDLGVTYGFAATIGCFAAIRTALGLGRMIVHGPAEHWLSFLLLGLLPLVFSAVIVVYNRMAAKLVKPIPVEKKNIL